MTPSGEISLSLSARNGGLTSDQENGLSGSQGLPTLDFSGLSESDDVAERLDLGDRAEQLSEQVCARQKRSMMFIPCRSNTFLKGRA